MIPDRVAAGLRAEVEQYGRRAIGQTDFLAFLDGRYLSSTRRIRAHCYHCMSYYADGIRDCGVSSCPLYSLMPYGRYGKSSRSRPDPRSAHTGAGRPDFSTLQGVA